MAGQFHVREAVLEDARAIAEAHVLGWQVAYPGIVPASVLDSLDVATRTERWEQSLRGEVTEEGVATPTRFVVERDGVVIGFAIVGEYRAAPSPDAAELWAMYVHPDHDRCGAGSALMEQTIKHFAGNGATTGHLWVLTENMIGRSFYEKKGWSVAPESEAAPEVLEMDGEKVTEVRYTIDVS